MQGPFVAAWAMGAHDKLVMGEKLHSHRIGDGTGTTGNGIDLSGIKCSISPWTYFKGAIAHCMVWGGLQLGALSPVVTLATYQLLGPRCAVLFLACAILSVLAPSRHSPAFCRFYLGSAACVGGSTVWVPDKILQLLQGRGYLLLGRSHWNPNSFSSILPAIWVMIWPFPFFFWLSTITCHNLS